MKNISNDKSKKLFWLDFQASLDRNIDSDSKIRAIKECIAIVNSRLRCMEGNDNRHDYMQGCTKCDLLGLLYEASHHIELEEKRDNE